MSSREVISAWGVFLFLFHLETCKQQSQETAGWARRERVQQRFGWRESRVQRWWRSVKPGFAGADGAELQMWFTRLSLRCASEFPDLVCPAAARAPGLRGAAAGVTRGSVALGSGVARQQRDPLPRGDPSRPSERTGREAGRWFRGRDGSGLPCGALGTGKGRLVVPDTHRLPTVEAWGVL